MRGLAVGAAIGTAILAFACGAEDVELAPATVSDAGVADASDETGRFHTDAGASGCDASPRATACRALGDPCGSGSDCCTTHCASGACVHDGTCGGAGSPCSSRSDCCSGLCEPVGGSPERACLAECRPEGAACKRASDCCALSCNAGTCQGQECQKVGSDCASDAQCCSNRCDATQGNKCALDPVATCRPSGEDCTSGGNTPCCGACDDSTKRCDPGAGACRAIGTVCERDTDCCHGTCAADAAGPRLCTSPPLADGTPCLAGFECASGSCVGNPPTCGAAIASCVASGESCPSNGPCCSGLCGANGSCQPGCVPANP